MEARKLTEMFSKALSTIFSKMKGRPPIEVGDTSIYSADIRDEALFICLIVTLTIFLANLMRPRSKEQRIHSKSSYKD